MKKILLSITVASTMLFAACGEKEKGEEEGKKDGEEQAEEPAKPAGTYNVAENSAVSWHSWMKNNEEKSHSGTIGLTGSVEVAEGKVTGGEFTFDFSTLIDPDMAEKDLGNLSGHLQSADFFAVDSLGAPTFKITGVSEGTVSGDLTIRAKTVSIDFPATIDVTEESVTATSETFTVDFTQFGMPWFAQDKEEEGKILDPEVELSIDVTATK